MIWSGCWGIAVAALLLCEAALLLVPLRVVQRRPITRRSLLFPLIGSGLLAGLLLFAGALATAEMLSSQKGAYECVWYLVSAGLAIWSVWAILFWRMAGHKDPGTIAAWLHRVLLAGSALELLIAVPAHLIVRRRTECCAGFYTGFGIAAGLAVMIVAFGPSVAILYSRRVRELTGGRK